MDKRELNKKPEIRSDEDGNTFIEGDAIVFNSESKDLGGFIEVVKPNAITSNTDVSDIMGRYNHDVLIGRTTTGTMSFLINESSVRYSIKLPKSDPGPFLEEMVGRGDINGSSFAFDVKRGGDTWEERDDGVMQRTITEFSKIYDMGPVDSPAYGDTTSALRSMEKYKKFNSDSELHIKQKVDRICELRKMELIEIEILEK